MKNPLLIIFLALGFSGFTQPVHQLNENSVGLENFEFTLGKWQFEWYHLDPSSGEFIFDGFSHSHVYLIQDGRTFADDFHMEKKDGAEVSGTTFRSFDPVENKLRMKWMVSGTFSSVDMTGEKIGDELVFFMTEPQEDQYGKYRIRITFYDISRNRYKWKRDFVFEDGTIVEKTTFYVANRVQ